MGELVSVIPQPQQFEPAAHTCLDSVSESQKEFWQQILISTQSPHLIHLESDANIGQTCYGAIARNSLHSQNSPQTGFCPSASIATLPAVRNQVRESTHGCTQDSLVTQQQCPIGGDVSNCESVFGKSRPSHFPDDSVEMRAWRRWEQQLRTRPENGRVGRHTYSRCPWPACCRPAAPVDWSVTYDDLQDEKLQSPMTVNKFNRWHDLYHKLQSVKTCESKSINEYRRSSWCLLRCIYVCCQWNVYKFNRQHGLIPTCTFFHRCCVRRPCVGDIPITN